MHMEHSYPTPEVLAAALNAAAANPVTIFQPPLWVPCLPEGQHGDWSVRQVRMLTMKGYWGDAYLVPESTLLLRNANESWMSVTPSELESQEIGCRLAEGHVAVLGMGMGIAACNAALNPAVRRVTVVELDRRVIAMAEAAGIVAQLPAEAAAKVRVVHGDARAWQPGEPVDTLLADYWYPFYEEGRAAEMRAVQANVGARQVFFWGQELNLAVAIHARFGGLARLDDDALAGVVESDLGLPLLWPRGEDYGASILAAAQHWLPLPLRLALQRGEGAGHA